MKHESWAQQSFKVRGWLGSHTLYKMLFDATPRSPSTSAVHRAARFPDFGHLFAEILLSYVHTDKPAAKNAKHPPQVTTRGR
ncbi:hypothetical protein predicted by Glimmer [Corynebacterium glutamicum ATCC 13032]|nr:hypothetical protein predicted by Glimmer [Corynebacterium glutamicum ATCC 13032]